MDADIIFDEIKETIKNDVLACFESQRFQSNYQHQVEQILKGSKNPKQERAEPTLDVLAEANAKKERERAQYLESLNAERLAMKVEELQKLIAWKNQTYFRELEYHRQNAYRYQKQMLEHSQMGEEQLSIKFFDEEDDSLFVLKKPEDQKTSIKMFIEGEDVEISPKEELYREQEQLLLSKGVRENIVQRMNERLDQMRVKYALTLNEN